MPVGRPRRVQAAAPSSAFRPGGLLRADWLIGDCWVELAGRMSDAKYAEKMALKQDLAQQLGLRHLVLLPLEVKRLSLIHI